MGQCCSSQNVSTPAGGSAPAGKMSPLAGKVPARAESEHMAEIPGRIISEQIGKGNMLVACIRESAEDSAVYLAGAAAGDEGVSRSISQYMLQTHRNAKKMPAQNSWDIAWSGAKMTVGGSAQQSRFPDGKKIAGFLTALSEHGFVPTAAPKYGSAINADVIRPMITFEKNDLYKPDILFLSVKDVNQGKLCAAGPQDAIAKLQKTITQRLQQTKLFLTDADGSPKKASKSPPVWHAVYNKNATVGSAKLEDKLGDALDITVGFDEEETAEAWDIVWQNVSVTWHTPEDGSVVKDAKKVMEGSHFPKGQDFHAIIEEVYALGYHLMAAPSFGSWPCLIFMAPKQRPPVQLVPTIFAAVHDGKICISGGKAQTVAHRILQSLRRNRDHRAESDHVGAVLQQDDDFDWDQVIRNTHLTTASSKDEDCEAIFFSRQDTIQSVLGCMADLGWSLAGCPSFGHSKESWASFVWHHEGDDYRRETAFVCFSETLQKMCLDGSLRGVNSEADLKAIGGSISKRFTAFHGGDQPKIALELGTLENDPAFMFKNTSVGKDTMPFGFPMEVLLTHVAEQSGWSAAGCLQFNHGSVSCPVLALQRREDASMPATLAAEAPIAALRAELEKMAKSDLRTRATASGVSQTALLGALDADETTAALVELILAAEASKATQAGSRHGLTERELADFEGLWCDESEVATYKVVVSSDFTRLRVFATSCSTLLGAMEGKDGHLWMQGDELHANGLYIRKIRMRLDLDKNGKTGKLIRQIYQKTTWSTASTLTPLTSTQIASQGKYSAPRSIWRAMEKKDTVLIKGSWLIETRGRKLPRRQDLPKEAIWDIAELRELQEKCEVFFMALSYAWASPEHPDPNGEQMGKLADILEQRLKVQYTQPTERNRKEPDGGKVYQDAACFVDFASLHQVERTPAETNSFKGGLKNCNLWYAHEAIEAWLLTTVPLGVTPYTERGWPTFERAISSMITPDHMLLDIGQYKADNAKSWPLIYKECKAGRSPPKAPDLFNAELAQKKFTNGADIEMVQGKYTSTFEKVLAGVVDLSFSNLMWTDDEALVLATAMPACKTCAKLDLKANEIGGKGATAIVEAAALCPSLEVLSLTKNLLGNGACCSIAPHIANIPAIVTLWLNECDVDDAGAIALAEVVPDCKAMRNFYLFDNAIGENGAKGILEMLPKAPHLVQFGIGGNEGIGEETQTRLKEAWNSVPRAEGAKIYLK